MSSDTLAHVRALHTKAKELASKGHLLHAAENFGRAAEAARALGEDNLVFVHLQLQRGNMLGSYAMAAPDQRVCAPQRAGCIAVFSSAVEVLERRRLAGTLLAGKCTAVEEEYAIWRSTTLQHEAVYATNASVAALAGYAGFLLAATNLCNLLLNAVHYRAECSYTQFQSFAHHVAHAAELMQQPRYHNSVGIVVEAEFTGAFREAMEHLRPSADGLDARLVQLLEGAWQRLQRSGVLQLRNYETGIGYIAARADAFHAAVQKSLTTPGLLSCALAGCGAKEAHPAHFKSCAACRTVVYCCREHQVEGWPAHKKACKAARKAKTEDQAGPSGA